MEIVNLSLKQIQEWKGRDNGMTTLDPMSMVMAGRNSAALKSQTIPYDRGVIALEIERTSTKETPPEWWSYGIRQTKREEAVGIVSFLKHKFFVLTPIF